MAGLHAGITFEITAFPRVNTSSDIRSDNSEDIIAYIDDRFGNGLYEVKREDGKLRFRIKDEYLEPKDFSRFLEHQFSLGAMFGENSPYEIADLINNVRNCNDQRDILKYAAEKSQFVLRIHSPEYLYVDIGPSRHRLDVSSLTFLAQDDVCMEAHQTIMAYLSGLLKR